MSNATIFGCRLKILWVYTFILGFAYEKPIFYVTSLDRLNPRLFDILIVIGVILFWKDIFKPNKFPKSIGYWKWLVIWFGFCALTWFTFFLPVEKVIFLFFLLLSI